MNKPRLTFVLLAVAFLVLVERQSFSEPEMPPTLEPLFTGENPLEDWTVRRWDDVSEPAASRWEYKDGVLHGGEPRGSWLLSEREFANFILEFEFKLGPLGNSGLALRAPLDGDPAFDGIELQMAELKYNPDAKPSELTGGLYRAIAPLENAYRSGEWNHYLVTMNGPRLSVKLNGKLIHDIDLDDAQQVSATARRLRRAGNQGPAQAGANRLPGTQSWRRTCTHPKRKDCRVTLHIESFAWDLAPAAPLRWSREPE